MRTTIQLDDDILNVARVLAAAKRISIGRAISELARKGIAALPRKSYRAHFPTFAVAEGAPPLTLADVKRLDDEA